MSDRSTTPERFNDMEAGRRELGMSPYTLWVGYFSVGGNGSLGDVESWLSGRVAPSSLDHDLLAQALNDGFIDRGFNHPVGYSRD